MILSLLFNVGVYGTALVAADFLRRRSGSYTSSATFQRGRWRHFGLDRGLVPTGSSGELTGVWRGLTVVLDTHFVPGRLVLGVRVLGLVSPEAAVDALRTDRFADWPAGVADGELRLHLPLGGSTLGPDDVEAALDAVRGTVTTSGDIYRS